MAPSIVAGDAGRFIVRAEEKLTAFLELESAIRTLSGKALHENEVTPDWTRSHRFR